MTPPSGVAWTHELHVAPAATSTAQARDFVEAFCEQRDLSYLTEDIGLVVTELVAHAVVHARARIRVTIEEGPSGVQLTVYDDTLDHPVARLASQLLATDKREWASWVVEACSADWGTNVTGDEGKCTWALFAVRPESLPVETGQPALRLITGSHTQPRLLTALQLAKAIGPTPGVARFLLREGSRVGERLQAVGAVNLGPHDIGPRYDQLLLTVLARHQECRPGQSWGISVSEGDLNRMKRLGALDSALIRPG